jgi:hypothetical protein
MEKGILRRRSSGRKIENSVRREKRSKSYRRAQRELRKRKICKIGTS